MLEFIGEKIIMQFFMFDVNNSDFMVKPSTEVVRYIIWLCIHD